MSVYRKCEEGAACVNNEDGGKAEGAAGGSKGPEVRRVWRA